MTNAKATQRYFGVLIPAAIVFLVTSYALRVADNAALLSTPWLYAATLAPIAAMLGMFWAHWRYVSEIDEFLRSIQIKAAFAGLAAVMTVATSWGYMEFYAEAPPLSVFWLNPFYWIAYSVAAVTLNWRYGGAS